MSRSLLGKVEPQLGLPARAGTVKSPQPATIPHSLSNQVSLFDQQKLMRINLTDSGAGFELFLHGYPRSDVFLVREI
jgi:hypothetical protein